MDRLSCPFRAPHQSCYMPMALPWDKINWAFSPNTPVKLPENYYIMKWQHRIIKGNHAATKWQLNLTQGSALGKNTTEQAPRKGKLLSTLLFLCSQTHKANVLSFRKCPCVAMGQNKPGLQPEERKKLLSTYD